MNERRRFLTYAAGVSAAVTGARVLAAAEPSLRASEFLLSERTRLLLSLFGIQYPILQVPVGFSSGPDLVIAVNKAGGLGSMALTRATPEEANDRVKKVLSSTKVPFVVNYILGFEPKSRPAALTFPSSGQLPGYALQPPLISNVRPRRHLERADP